MIGPDRREKPLSELCELIVDSEHRTAPKDPDGIHPLVRTTNLGRAALELRSAHTVNASTYRRWTRRAEPQHGDLILAREAPVGGVGRVPEGIHPVLGQRTVLLRPAAGVDSRFLLYRLAADDMQARMAELATGATVPHLNMADIREFPVDVPVDLELQVRVGDVLGAFDELIEINERRIELLDDLARSLYREWFVRFRFPGRSESRAHEVLPSGWTMKRLDAVADVVMGQSPKSEFYNDDGDGLPFHQGVANFGGLIPEHKKFSTVAPRKAAKGDVLCSVRAPVGRLNVADAMMVVGRGVAAIRRHDGSTALMYEQLRAAVGDEDSLGGGTIFKAIGRDELTGLRVLEPPAEVARSFDALGGPALDQRISLTVEKRRLETTRDLLLPKLVTGQLDVSEIDLDGLMEAHT